MSSAATQYTTYPIKNLFFLLLFANQELQPTHSFLPNNSNIVRFSQYRHSTSRSTSTSTTTYAGFGASSTKKNKKSKKKRKGGLLSDDLNLKPIIKSNENENEAQKQPEVELDRFGLPVRNAENFFPPLPEGTELKGYDATNTKLVDIEEAMGKHIQLNYDIFDEGGVEKIDVKNANANTNANGKPWKMRLLHKSPPVLEIQNFFTEEECAEYMSISDPPDSDLNSDSQSQSQSPLMVNSATFSSLAQSKRTSTTWFCHYSQVPALLAKAKRLLNDLPLRQMEEAQIVRYRTGEEFSWHYDEIPKAQLENGGQRIATLLVYLNTNSKGGGTIFRDLKDNNHNDNNHAADADAADGVLTMRPKTGSALLFFPAFLDGTPDDRTLHKGEVAVEKKMIAQMWIHERDYKPVIPEGNSHEAALEAIERKERELGYRV